MRILFIITLLLSLGAVGQERSTDEQAEVYKHIVQEFIDKDAYVIDETFTPIKKYDIDGNYQRWFYQSFARGMIVSVVPIMYESTVLDFLLSKDIHLDTESLFRQIEVAAFDSLSKYEIAANLISFDRAPLRHSFFGNLFKKKKAVGLSRILFDSGSETAIVKLQVYSKKKQSAANPSNIIILQKQGDYWKTLGVLQEKLQLTAVLQ